jgi:hypothetical protein
MALTNVFTGSNGTLTLANDSTPEGNDSKAIMDVYTMQTVGRVTAVEIYVQTDLEEFHEIGSRQPISLNPGNIHISGKVGRAYVNGALLFLLLGRAANTTNLPEPHVQPAFNMVVQMSDAASPPNSAVLELQGVKFQNWAYLMPENDFVMENVTFKALAIRVADKEAGSAITPAFP